MGCTADTAPSYLITQQNYGDDTTQRLSYTILTPAKELILVDGGWASDAESLRKIINKNGGVVHVWILTHPHPDHIGAFNEIFASPDKIEIRQIYATEMDYEYYRQMSQPWDEFAVYERFLALTEGDERLTYLRIGDVLDILGLEALVLSAGPLSEGWSDPCNNSSLVLKLSAAEQSFLITGDASQDMAARIMGAEQSYAADYLQMSHHGNGGLGDEFYQIVNPTVAFFDAPESLRNPPEGSSWNTPHNMELMQSLGAEVLTWETAPNTVRLD
jgi:beta-lactamase superfamily II metal-dependent hydrolase